MIFKTQNCFREKLPIPCRRRLRSIKNNPQVFNWVKLDQYVPIIQAEYPDGRVFVNGVALDQIGGRTFGRFYIGDLVTIFSAETAGSRTPVEFRCEFLYGLGAQARKYLYWNLSWNTMHS